MSGGVVQFHDYVPVFQHRAADQQIQPPAHAFAPALEFDGFEQALEQCPGVTSALAEPLFEMGATPVDVILDDGAVGEKFGSMRFPVEATSCSGVGF
ncbi:MAG: hypothetical protein RKO24_09030, partial [Candidatus Competibacter sp.]|nr:hypothetical protein [Candidatus Competibacter sp.]